MEESLIIRKADLEDINEIGFLANDIWPKVYHDMISMDQIRYMLTLFYNPESLRKQMTELHHNFLIAEMDQVPVGFASFSVLNEEICKLHKLYVQPGIQGKGLGKALVEAVLDECFELGAKILRLNVNRNNKAIGFYKKMDFVITGEENLDIGEGYFMDDYVMERLVG